VIYKRGKFYWYKFMWNGELIRESTKQGNDKIARNMESAHRTALAQGLVGIREKKPIPTLTQFIDNRFEPWAKATFEKTSPKTWFDWYRVGLRALKARKAFAELPLPEITSEAIAAFAAHRQSEGKQISTVNSTLRVLRRVLRMAVEWGVLDAAPKVKALPGERHRERVVTPEEEARYLAVASEPLASVATVLVDTGLRPEECFRLRWETITWNNARHGTLMVTHGKTAAARRLLPMTLRVRNVDRKSTRLNSSHRLSNPSGNWPVSRMRAGSGPPQQRAGISSLQLSRRSTPLFSKHLRRKPRRVTGRPCASSCSTRYGTRSSPALVNPAVMSGRLPASLGIAP